MLFSEFSFLCEALEKTPSRLSKKKLLRAFFLLHTPEAVSEAIHFLTFHFFYEQQAVLFQLDEIQMVKIIAEYTEKDIDSVRKSIKHEMSGDIGTYYSVYGRSNLQSPLFQDIFREICEFGAIEGENSQETRKKKIFSLLDKVSKEDARYLLRLFVGTFRIGVSDKTILEVIFEIFLVRYGERYKDIDKKKFEQIYGVFSNLGKIVYFVLTNQIEKLLSVEPKIGMAVQSQTAEVFFKNNALLLDFSKYSYVIQPKYDGFRLQAHVTKEQEIFLFSRNQILVNHLFPTVTIALKKYALQNSFYGVIDGEVIGFDRLNNFYLTFQDTAKEKREKKKKTDKKESIELQYIIFDLLLFKEVNLMNEAYQKRLQIIESQDEREEIKHVNSFPVFNIKEIEEQHNLCIKNKYEGLMIKDLAAPYEAGKRTRTWLKYKKIQKDSLEDTIDVVILGYTLSKGMRSKRQMIGSLLVGVYDEATQHYTTVAQVGSGGNQALWNVLYENLYTITVSAQLENVFISKAHVPDYFVIPKIVVSVKADLVSLSKDHTAGVSLRFPRLLTIRPDKNEKESTDIRKFLSE